MGTCLSIFFLMQQNVVSIPLYLLIFITYFGGYTYAEFQYQPAFRKVMAVNAILGIVCIILIFYHHHLDQLIRWGIIGFLGLLYNSKFLKKSIRKIPYVKIFYVGMTWGLMNAWLGQDQISWPIFFINLIFISSLILPFDIRDIEKDREHQIVTFPNSFGIAKTKILAYFLFLVSSVLSIYFLEYRAAVSFVVANVVAIILTYFSKFERDDFYFSFWVESCSGIPLLVYWLLTL